MIMAEATGGNGAPPPRAVMMSIAEIASRDGVTKPGVSRRVKQLRESGLHVELDAQGRVALVNVAQYDELRHRFGDPAKAQAPDAASTPLSAMQSESYDEARRQLTWIAAEREKLKLEADQGKLVPIEALEAATDRLGDGLLELVDRLPQAADDLAAAVAQNGVAGLRTGLKKLALEFKTEIADALAGLAAREAT
jgi:CRP-like cAMP-binding protein